MGSFIRWVVLLWLGLLISRTSQTIRPQDSKLSEDFFHHSEAKRTSTDAVVYARLTEEHPDSHITIVPLLNANLFSFASGGAATIVPIVKDVPSLDSYSWRYYTPPFRRLDGGNGTLGEQVKFGIYQYIWKNEEFLVYLVEGRDGMGAFPYVTNQYVISDSQTSVDTLVLAAGYYTANLHDEIWVFDQGYWHKDSRLWRSIQQSHWDDVILDQEMKKSIQNDISRFFSGREQYTRLRVPWKRGLIFHGPPGNGKTISIKAIMHTLYNFTSPIPTMYVKSFTSSQGPEFAIKQIFSKARAEAPCFLVLEDLDSLVTAGVRSYFLNQVDGLQINDGILMVGSTNHLEQLDPGISKRPSRFDRKYYFPDPNLEERILYCEFWRERLKDNEEVEFPKRLVSAIANITNGFSFAYIQEAFVATLLEIAREPQEDRMTSQEHIAASFDRNDLNRFKLWRVIRKQISILRKELEEGDPEHSGRGIGMVSGFESFGDDQKHLLMTPPNQFETL